MGDFLSNYKAFVDMILNHDKNIDDDYLNDITEKVKNDKTIQVMLREDKLKELFKDDCEENK